MPQTRKAILGEKLGMTQVFDQDRRIVPVTVVRAGTNVVTQIRTQEVDGYVAVQLGFGDIKPTRVNKPVDRSVRQVAGVNPPQRHLAELRLEDEAAAADYDGRPGADRRRSSRPTAATST